MRIYQIVMSPIYRYKYKYSFTIWLQQIKASAYTINSIGPEFAPASGTNQPERERNNWWRREEKILDVHGVPNRLGNNILLYLYLIIK